MTTASTLDFLKSARCHAASADLMAAITSAANEIARAHGLSERESEIVLRHAASALLWLPKL
jgi:hypothetical protein